MTQLIFASNPIAMIVVLLVALAIAVEAPFRLYKENDKLASIDNDVWNIVQGGLLTLVAFMLGLSYAQAQGRFDTRRDLVVKEANVIGTTWLRADQLAPAATLRFRRTLTDYTRERLDAYGHPTDRPLVLRVIHDSDEQQARMWAMVSSAVKAQPGNLGTSLLMQTLNETIDTSSEQFAALSHHVPTPVIVMTFLLLLLGSASIGLQFARGKSRPAALSALYVVALALVVNLVIDYDRAQTGLIRVPLEPLAIQLQAME